MAPLRGYESMEQPQPSSTRRALRFWFDGERGRCWRRPSCHERSATGTRDLSAVASSTAR